MKWIAISGSWRLSSAELDAKLSLTIDGIVKNGDGIVSGGALGVDYKATAKMMAIDDWKTRIKVVIPTSLKIYKKHYFKRADEGVITKLQATELIDQLSILQTAGCLTEMGYACVDKETYYARNEKVVELADELWAFQINNSQGVQDTIGHAEKKNIKIRVWKFKVEEKTE